MNAAVRAFEHYLIKRTRGRLIPNKLVFIFFYFKLAQQGPQQPNYRMVCRSEIITKCSARGRKTRPKPDPRNCLLVGEKGPCKSPDLRSAVHVFPKDKPFRDLIRVPGLIFKKALRMDHTPETFPVVQYTPYKQLLA